MHVLAGAVEVEIPGTPEDAWQAIATGPGISSWLMPTTIEESGGKPIAATSTVGAGMEARATVTAWGAPRKGCGGAPPIATDGSVEARAGGACIVRVVNRPFSSKDEWDNQLMELTHKNGHVGYAALSAARSCFSHCIGLT